MLAHRQPWFVAGVTLLAAIGIVLVIIGMSGRSDAERAASARAARVEQRLAQAASLGSFVQRELLEDLAMLPGSTETTRKLVGRMLGLVDSMEKTLPAAEDADAAVVEPEADDVRRALADSYRALAGVQGAAHRLADPEQALLTLAKGIAILEEVMGRRPRDPGVTLELAGLRMLRGEYLFDLGDDLEAARVIETVRKEVAWLVDEEDLSRRAWELRARCARVSALLRGRQGHWRLAASGLSHARSMLPGPPAPDAPLEAHARGIDWDLERLAILRQNGDEEGAQVVWESIEPRILTLAPKDSRDVRVCRLRATAQRQIGDFLLDAGDRFSEALSHYREAVEILESLHHFDPNREDYAEMLAHAHDGVVEALSGLSRRCEALGSARESVRLRRRLARSAPRSERRQRELRVALRELAEIEREREELDASRRDAEKAREIAARLKKANPENIDLEREFADATDDLAASHWAYVRAAHAMPGVDRTAAIRTARGLWTEALMSMRRVAAARPGVLSVDRKIEALQQRVGRCEAMLGVADSAPGAEVVPSSTRDR